jgi:hypothetical protein
MRIRKFTKVDFSHTRAFRMERELLARNYEQIKNKKDAMIAWEVGRMFGTLGVNPIEQKIPREALGVNFAPVKDIKMTVKKTKVTPTTKTLVKNAMMPATLIGSDFVKETLFIRETHQAIDWDNYGSRKRPEEVFESLQECYIIM